jgi:hypothetical protein
MHFIRANLAFLKSPTLEAGRHSLRGGIEKCRSFRFKLSPMTRGELEKVYFFYLEIQYRLTQFYLYEHFRETEHTNF